MRGLLVLLALGLGLSASAAEKKLTLIFTGDNGGEIAPCG
jgi:hypothetical protein